MGNPAKYQPITLTHKPQVQTRHRQSTRMLYMSFLKFIYNWECYLVNYLLCLLKYGHIQSVPTCNWEVSRAEKVEDSASTVYLVKSIFDIFYEMQFIMVSDTMSLMSLLKGKKCLYLPSKRILENTGCFIIKLLASYLRNGS